MKMESIPDLILERYLLDELPCDIKDHIAGLLQTDQQLGQRLEQMRCSNDLLLQRFPQTLYGAPILRRLGAVHTPVRNWLRSHRTVFKPALAGISSFILLLVVGGILLVRPKLPPSDILPKGGTNPTTSFQLHIFCLRDRYLEPLDDGARVKPGARLQLAYSARDKRYGVLVSFDGRGQITLHFPERQDMPTLLAQGRQLPLPHSYELDQVADFERFILVSANKEIAVSDVLQRLAVFVRDQERAATAPLPFAPPLQTNSILLRKER
jgi:hypothetical protein